MWTFQDDGFGAWKGSKESLMDYLQSINNIDDRFKITYEISSTSIQFMDLIISKGERFNKSNKLDVQIYQKEINKFLYIPYSSFHTKQGKESFMFSELDRYATHNSSYYNYRADKNKFYQRLRVRGYPPWFLDKVFSRHFYYRRTTLLQKRSFKHSNCKVMPLLFKTKHSSRHKTMGLKAFLAKAHKLIQEVPSLKKFHERPPLVCLKRGKNLHEVLRPR
jgi:hypothetical protein